MSKINRDCWIIDSFSYRKPAPPWTCPICNVGIITGDKNTLKIEHTRSTLKARHSLTFENSEGIAEFRFAGFMVCNNNHCREKIAVAGRGELFASASDEPVNIQFKGERYSVYIPKYFEPALNIFYIPESCPAEIIIQIKKSFYHFFNDLNACANATRTSLELILNDQGIPNSFEKGNVMSLGQRIEKFKDINPNIKPFIEAVKWIGNAGSHIESVNKNDILDGYELLKYVIEELYERKKLFSKLSEKAIDIISTRKSLKK